MKYLEMYKEWAKTGELPRNGGYSHIITGGLCSLIDKDKLYPLHPISGDYAKLQCEDCSTAYWASGIPGYSKKDPYKFTPLRQNIVLFLAAMAGELD